MQTRFLASAIHAGRELAQFVPRPLEFESLGIALAPLVVQTRLVAEIAQQHGVEGAVAEFGSRLQTRDRRLDGKLLPVGAQAVEAPVPDDRVLRIARHLEMVRQPGLCVHAIHGNAARRAAAQRPLRAT